MRHSDTRLLCRSPVSLGVVFGIKNQWRSQGGERGDISPLSYPRGPASIRTVTLCSLTTFYFTKKKTIFVRFRKVRHWTEKQFPGLIGPSLGLTVPLHV